MKSTSLVSSLVLALAAAVPVAAQYINTPSFGNVTPEVIFGGGNINGSYTINTTSLSGLPPTPMVELGLRGKLRFNASNLPENTFNHVGGGVYQFNPGSPTGGASWVSSTTPVWNFEWSINSDVAGLTGAKLNAYTYTLGVDFDPTAGTNFYTVDPINLAYFDHSFGNNSTGNSAGVEAPLGDTTTYASYIGTYNVAQNSVNMEFINNSPFDTFDPNVGGDYEIYLAWNDGSGEQGRTTIHIQVIPEPGTYALLFGIAGLGVVLWRRRRR